MPFLDHFDLIAPYYDRIFQRHGVASLATYVAPGPSHRLLDVGGGTGRIAQYFVNLVAQVCILDPSPQMLLEGQRKGICITQGLSEQIPFEAGSFDRIIVVDAFHHMIDQQAAACELMRVLAAGGRLVVEEPDIAHWGVKLVALLEKLALMRSHFYPTTKIGAMFAQAGGQVHVERQGYTVWVVVNKPSKA